MTFVDKMRSAWPKDSYPAGIKPMPFILGLETLLLRWLVNRSLERMRCAAPGDLMSNWNQEE